MRWRNLRRYLRRFHRHLAMVLLSLYVVSGVTMLAICETPQIQGWIHIAIGILHGIA